MKRLLLIPLIFGGLFAVSCSETTTAPTRKGPSVAAYQAFNVPASRPSNPSAVRVKVSLKNQAVYVMENGRPLLVAPVGVGKPSKPTPRGNFTIYSKEQYRRANTHGWASNGAGGVGQFRLGKQPSGWKFVGTPMPYWCEFKSGYGFHTGWVKPYPSTHGCLRLHENIAPKFFALVKKGTPVNIAYSQPEDATVGRNVARAPDAGPLPDYNPSMYLGNGYFSRHKPVTFN